MNPSARYVDRPRVLPGVYQIRTADQFLSRDIAYRRRKVNEAAIEPVSMIDNDFARTDNPFYNGKMGKAFASSFEDENNPYCSVRLRS